jgi:hypothetical protein
MSVVAAAGVNSNNVKSIIMASKVHGVHAGSAVTIKCSSSSSSSSSSIDNDTNKINMGLTSNNDDTWETVDRNLVKIFVDNANDAYNHNDDIITISNSNSDENKTDISNDDDNDTEQLMMISSALDRMLLDVSLNN